jgi:lysozyme family protein
MDLKNFAPKSDEVEVVVLHPGNGEPLINKDGSQMTITLAATHSKEYKVVLHEQTDKRIKASKGSGQLEFKSKEMEEASLEILAKATKSWNITYDGAKPKLTVAKAKAIYEELFWLKPQLEEAVTTTADFMNP